MRTVLFPQPLVRRVCLVLLPFHLAQFTARGETHTFEYSAYPDKTNNFAEASFSCRLPAGAPKAILFLAGGTDSDTRPWLDDPQWQKLAEEENLVLIAACLRGAGEPYEIASGGSGQALLDAVESFARASREAELAHLPLILFGHSAGAMFGFHFACWRSDRVRAIICQKSGALPEPKDAAQLSFPALFIVGQKDEAGRIRGVARAFVAGRWRGAPWTLAFQPDAGHDTRGCWPLVAGFVRAINSPDGDPIYGSLGKPGELAEGATAENDADFSWLPARAFLAQWQSFVTAASPLRLTSLPDDSPELKVRWEPILAFPEKIDQSSRETRFEYIVSVPATEQALAQVEVTASHPITALATRLSDRSWRVSGILDARSLPIGPFKTSLDATLHLAGSSQVESTITLLARITGPVSASPSSFYYGVLPRGHTTTFEVDIRTTGDPILECQAVSSDPAFLSVRFLPPPHPQHHRAQCTILSGARIGPRGGEIVITVGTARPCVIRVPFFGFVKK